MVLIKFDLGSRSPYKLGHTAHHLTQHCKHDKQIQAPIIQMADDAIQRVKHYKVDSALWITTLFSHPIRIKTNSNLSYVNFPVRCTGCMFCVDFGLVHLVSATHFCN